MKRVFFVCLFKESQVTIQLKMRPEIPQLAAVAPFRDVPWKRRHAGIGTGREVGSW